MSGNFSNFMHLTNNEPILIIFLVSQQDISGISFNAWQSPKRLYIVVTFFVFQLDISGASNRDWHLKKDYPLLLYCVTCVPCGYIW